MSSLLTKTAVIFLAACALPWLSPFVLDAQLVREAAARQEQRVPAMASAQDSAATSAPSGKPRVTQEVQLTGDSSWVDTGIDVQAGEHVVATATGTLRYADQQTDTAPAGIARGFKDLLRNLPFNGAGRGAVIGRVGDKDTSQPFLIGARRDIVSPIPGRLSIGINQLSGDTGDGTYSVRIEIYAADANAVLYTAKAVPSIRGVDNVLFSKIPRRITDKAGDLGDMVNFLIIGSQNAMEKVFTTAGWVKVDANVKETVLNGFLASMSKESYLTMPMSPLYLFGRQQDYGWAHAEPIAVVASRNHLRIWKASFEVNGQTLWVGAATHDVGIEKDQRNNGLTHKIDPNIDLERDYVEKTLTSTGLVAEVTHVLPKNPMQEAKTATGGSFHSNGQVLVLKLGELAQRQ
ncbi:MAG TPA: LssY C-terminal domain-containing protein [Candidatus Acidoferrum sp.]|nr:LssY C-terminal domain-containing protein [Candidatus Acidoferrum sp.]